MKKEVPDKQTHKGTTTRQLRERIAVDGGPDKIYLEIGIDLGYTLISLSPSFGKLLGVDIRKDKIVRAKKKFDVFGVKNIESIHNGTIHTYGNFYADVVFHDASHKYEDVLFDIEKIIEANTAEKFVLYVHDYGLKGSGVKQAVKKHFGNNIELCGLEKDGPVVKKKKAIGKLFVL